MEVSVVGDFTEEEIESCIIDYLGTIRAARESKGEDEFSPIVIRPSPSYLRSQQVYLKANDERACAYTAGPAPNRWGLTVEGEDLFKTVLALASDGGKDIKENLQRKLSGHPLFLGITMGILAEIINSRLFTTVRDSLGLTYDVSFELNLFDRLNLGWYVIHVTSTPAKVHTAVDACKNVLRGLHSNKIAKRELDRAKRSLLMRHEAEIKSNAYWLGLLAHFQASSVSRKNLSLLYEEATIEDIYLAYDQLKVGEDSLYSCIGIAGAQAGEEVIVNIEEEESIENLHRVIPMGHGLSTMARPTT